MKSQTTLITGASSGIGLALAHKFASCGHPLILTATDAAELETVAAEVRRLYDVDVDVFACDLEDGAAAEDLGRFVRSMGKEVHILVNNAGLGFRGNFWDLTLANDLSMIRVNILAPVKLTREFLPEMMQRRSGRILNTSSIAGFEPGPTLAVYHATKAFVLSFSEALASELEPAGIVVTALCPGATDTDFFPKADMVDTRAFQKNKVMSPQEVAQIGYDALMKGERVVVAGAFNKVMVFSRHLMPESAQAAKNEKLYEKVPPEDVTRFPGDIRDREPAVVG